MKENQELIPEFIPELLRIVYDDLTFLIKQERRTPSRTDARLASLILRRLLHDGLLLAAWKYAKLDGEPSFRTIDLAASVKDIPQRYVQYAYAGGADTEGAYYRAHILLSIPREELDKEGQETITNRLWQSMIPPEERQFSLQEFCGSPAVVTSNASVSRLDVIKYVANKHGGAHWDARRHMWTHSTGARHRFLDENHIMVGPLPATFYEVISIAQAIANAPDTARLLARIDEIAPPIEFSRTTLKFREGRIGNYTDMTYKTPDGAVNKERSESV